MERVTLIILLIVLSGCVQRGAYPGAEPSDVIACMKFAREESRSRRWSNENEEFNYCMEDAGYRLNSREWNSSVR